MRPNFGTLQETPLRVLDFDIENRPLSYWLDDRPTADVTAIAWGWIDQTKVEVRVQTVDAWSVVEMLEDFAEVYAQADVVTGHYIRKHDLPILNGAMVEFGLAPLAEKLASDTKLDLYSWKDLPQSQEYLSDMYNLSRPKHHMSQHEWREANRLSGPGVRLTAQRVTKDVRQHKQLRAHLVEAGALGPPQVWEP